LAPLLAACSGGGTGPGPDVTFNMPITLPDCAEGSLLTTDGSGNVKCASAPAGGKIPLPNTCGDNQALNSDGTNLNCVDKANGNGNPLNDKLTTLNTKVDDLTTKANAIKNGSGGSGYLSFKGLSTNTDTGHIKLRSEAYLGNTVQDNGIVAASNVCAKDFGAGARVCTVGDLFNSAVNGKLVRTALMTETAWIYNVSFQNPLSSPDERGPERQLRGLHLRDRRRQVAGHRLPVARRRHLRRRQG